MPVSRWPRLGRHRTPQGRGTPPRTKETKPCWIRDGRPQGSPQGGSGMGDRKGLVDGRPSCSGRRGDAIAPAGRAVAHAGFPMASFGSAPDATRAWDATSHEGNEAVLDSRWATARVVGWATARVVGWATARVAPTRASSPICSGRRGDAIAPAGRAVAHVGFPMTSFGSAPDATRASPTANTDARASLVGLRRSLAGCCIHIVEPDQGRNAKPYNESYNGA